jgi:hypothetical protein
MLTTVAKEIRSIELHQKQNKCTSGSAAGRDTQKRGGDDDSMDDSDEDDALLHLDSGKEQSTQCQGKDDAVEGKSVGQKVKQGERTSAGKKSSVEDDSDEAGKPSGKRRAVGVSKPEAAVATKKGSALTASTKKDSKGSGKSPAAAKSKGLQGEGGRGGKGGDDSPLKKVGNDAKDPGKVRFKPSTLKPIPYTLNTKPSSLNPSAQPPNCKPQTLNP